MLQWMTSCSQGVNVGCQIAQTFHHQQHTAVVDIIIIIIKQRYKGSVCVWKLMWEYLRRRIFGRNPDYHWTYDCWQTDYCKKLVILVYLKFNCKSRDENCNRYKYTIFYRVATYGQLHRMVTATPHRWKNGNMTRFENAHSSNFYPWVTTMLRNNWYELQNTSDRSNENKNTVF